jgi:hypothetical protein
VKSKALEHAPDLPIDSLFEHNVESHRRNLLHPFGAGAFSIENNAAQKSLRQICGGCAVKYDFVFLFDLEPRMRQALRKVAVVREYQQTFTLSVEPADVGERRKFRRQQIVNGVGGIWIPPGADKASRFVQQNVNVGALMNEFAIDFDVIGRGRLKMKIVTRFSIHGYATGRDQFICAAT